MNYSIVLFFCGLFFFLSLCKSYTFLLGGSFKSTSTSTKIVNGQSVTTKKVVENGKETIEIYENNKLVKKTVDGVPQLTNGSHDSHRMLDAPSKKKK